MVQLYTKCRYKKEWSMHLIPRTFACTIYMYDGAYLEWARENIF